MSITVADLLELPSLRGAKVVAGQGGLSRIISSVSVLEYAEPSFLQDELFHNNEFYGSEIVITAFANIRDNVDAQCANIRRLSEAGEVGLILYYVGLLLPRVDRALIELADSLDFTLICMPEKRMDLRYSEVICEVMETIFRDQSNDVALVSEVLDRVSRLPVHQRTIDTVLKMVCDRLHTSIMLTDASGRVLNEVAWPRTAAGELLAALPQLDLPAPGADPVRLNLLGGCWGSRWSITADGAQPMHLLLFQEKMPEATTLRQVVEVVQLAVNLWSRQHDELALTELVRAILQDEPMKMRRLADLFRVDVASIHTMWILRCEDEKDKARLSTVLDPVRRTAESVARTAVAALYQEDLVLFLDGPNTLADANSLYEELRRLLDEYGIPAILTQCDALGDTTQVRAAFLDNQLALSAARIIFPGRLRYTLGEIKFARSCQEQMAEGEHALISALACLTPLQQAREGEELLRTLTVYLLDCGSSVSRTAQALFLHKNTVKYRLQKLADLLGRQVDRMPESIYLYEAAALRRMMY